MTPPLERARCACRSSTAARASGTATGARADLPLITVHQSGALRQRVAAVIRRLPALGVSAPVEN
jgi:hypothetical protein